VQRIPATRDGNDRNTDDQVEEGPKDKFKQHGVATRPYEYHVFSPHAKRCTILAQYRLLQFCSVQDHFDRAISFKFLNQSLE
jgi:hypothetical protein